MSTVAMLVLLSMNICHVAYQSLSLKHSLDKLHRAFRAWKSFTRKSAHDKSLKRKAEKHHNKALVSKAALAWKSYVHLCFRIKVSDVRREPVLGGNCMCFSSNWHNDLASIDNIQNCRDTEPVNRLNDSLPQSAIGSLLSPISFLRCFPHGGACSQAKRH